MNTSMTFRVVRGGETVADGFSDWDEAVAYAVDVLGLDDFEDWWVEPVR